MFKVFADALFDTGKMIPLLFFVYVLIEYLEYKFGSKFSENIKRKQKSGPVLGALFGCVPQCGFSVIATSFYIKRVITLGTLLAVYLSTSDEAVPVILAHPEKSAVIIPILLLKVVIAIIAGFIIDFIVNKKALKPDNVNSVCDEHAEKGCCGHECPPDKLNIREFIVHPIIHTFKVFIFIFIVSFIINLIIFKVGEDKLGNFMLANSVFQPMLAGLIGLIPNCAASVVITQIYLQGGISFGSVIAGLSTAAGLGLIVLFKENRNLKENFRIIAILYAIGVGCGIIIQFIYG